ncbi:hypothetical protein PCL_00028 [Purpureocillium lilacinum]|uniref:Uncharacterized protein n=1 Tax=Purpureocillium lilacinum TaxID=33203 RepID=A0A2U3DP78_PURLI|nr:hypothetical protein PCL_00028 [Purpureocillium lilacinum]
MLAGSIHEADRIRCSIESQAAPSHKGVPPLSTTEEPRYIDPNGTAIVGNEGAPQPFKCEAPRRGGDLEVLTAKLSEMEARLRMVEARVAKLEASLRKRKTALEETQARKRPATGTHALYPSRAIMPFSLTHKGNEAPTHDK